MSRARGEDRVNAMRILLLCSAFNGLSQRAWIELCARGHEVSVALASDEAKYVTGVALNVDGGMSIRFV